MPEVRIESLNTRHFSGVIALQALCFPPPFDSNLLWKIEHLERHLEIFSVGQHVATIDETIVGSSTTMILEEANWNMHGDWESTTGGHFLPRHDGNGTTLFGVDISVHPDYQRRGVGRAIYQARFELVRSLSLARFGTACRMPDFLTSARQQPLLHPRDFALSVASGERTDRTLTPLLRMGVQLIDVIEGHMEDPESGHAAAILEFRP